MKFADRMKQLEPKTGPRRSHEQIVADRVRIERKRNKRLDAIDKERAERLTETDLALARSLRLPPDYEGRRDLCRSLKHAGDRERASFEIALIMGIRVETVWRYENFETNADYEAYANRPDRPKKVKVKTPEEKIEAWRTRSSATEVGVWIRRQRKARNMSVTSVERGLGLEQGLLRRWEEGECKPKPLQFRALREFLTT